MVHALRYSVWPSNFCRVSRGLGLRMPSDYSTVGADQSVEELRRELAEAHRREAATADVLKVISRSTSDLQTVLDTLVESAARLCDADFSFVYQRIGDLFHLVASHGFSGEFIEFQKQNLIPLGRGSLTGRTALECKVVHIPDVLEDPEYTWTKSIELARFRAMLGVPLLREGIPIGVIALLRGTARPFTGKQIELVTTFADQAVIAIENTRLFEEVQARTSELTEALDQQTATSEVLQVISTTHGELEPVFRAVLANATNLCEAKFGTLYLCEDDGFRAVAMHNASPEFAAERRRGPVHPGPGSALGQTARTKRATQLEDVMAGADYIKGDPFTVTAVELGGYRSVLAVPMLKEAELIGAMTIYRQEVGRFTDNQIELVSNFARQAVIAIENTRLFEAEQARTRELQEALEHQTATGEVLSVIGRSAFDLRPVLEAVIESATKLCGATRGHIFQFDGEFLRFAAAHGAWPGFTDYLEKHPLHLGRGSLAGTAASERRTVHALDVLELPDFKHGELLRQQPTAQCWRCRCCAKTLCLA